MLFEGLPGTNDSSLSQCHDNFSCWLLFPFCTFFNSVHPFYRKLWIQDELKVILLLYPYLYWFYVSVFVERRLFPRTLPSFSQPRVGRHAHASIMRSEVTSQDYYDRNVSVFCTPSSVTDMKTITITIKCSSQMSCKYTGVEECGCTVSHVINSTYGPR